ncbi:TlpA disulfide reductase family protein [Pedobacter panaciterrae]|uniref:TlpA disulfide reductase family protein n=1 Tax=Pedobacter panaciterrae TaxID=363849 RepID=A0ABU8NQH1_9SPHI
MKLIPFLCAFLITASSFAQKTTSFLLKGNVKNLDDTFFELATTGYFNNTVNAVLVDKKGNFSKHIYIDGIQDFYLYLNNDAITAFAVPGDTIEVNWDQKNFKNTFKINSPSPERAQDLSIMMAIYNKRRQPFLDLNRKLYEEKELADSSKYRLINDSYNAELNIIFSAPHTKYSITKTFYDAYFKHVGLLRGLRGNLLNIYKLKTDDRYSSPEYAKFDHTYLSEEIFIQSAPYRDFLFDQVRFHQPFKYYTAINGSGYAAFNPAKKDYQSGQAFLNIIPIRDWFSAKAIMFGFEHYDFKDVKSVYDDYLAHGSTPAYLDTVKTFYDNARKLAPGQPAPAFNLKDMKGNSVSLSDFKGKLVYIDFWGVYCGPCIGDIKENGTKMHEKYKDKDVVFLNICVDEKGSTWTDKVKELKLDGVNLVAEGWTTNQVCKDYNINAIPHYVLIDKEGKIINNNAPGLYQLAGDGANDLDKALKVEKSK